jgi:hypothetical protein
MQRIVMTAAAMLLGSGLVVSTAKAELHWGPEKDEAKNLCYKRSPNNDLGWGYWTECPKPAAAPAPASHRHAKHT